MNERSEAQRTRGWHQRRARTMRISTIPPASLSSSARRMTVVISVADWRHFQAH